MASNNAKTTVIRNGTLIDGSGSAASENEAVVIQENRITSVGSIPAGLNLEDK
jgi:N-acyl-D-aspartate/D-glutamate deacylase